MKSQLKIYKYWLISFAWVIGLGLFLIASQPDSKLRIIFCDVGQGDAELITLGSTQVLIDGGPDNKVLGCLSKHVPFWDRKIEMVVMTHPQSDHMEGLIDVLERYNVSRFVSGPERNETKAYQRLLAVIKEKKVAVANVYAGEKILLKSQTTNPKSQFGRLTFTVVWPERAWVVSHLGNNLANAGGVFGNETNGKVLGMATDGTDLNSFGIGLELNFGKFKALFTGDADNQIESEMLLTGLIEDIDVLKVPHHGSKTGMTPEWLDIVKPELAVIEVGRNNRYHHPRPEALQLLRERGIQVKRTDEDGEVVVATDGKGYWIESKSKTK